MAPNAEGTYHARAARCFACAARASAVDDWEGPRGGVFWAVDRIGAVTGG